MTNRIFHYATHQFADPGAQFTNEDVLAILARTYPELSGGSVRIDVQAGVAHVHLEPQPKRNG